MTEKACKNCGALSSGPVCPQCRSTNLSEDWSGLIIVLDPDKSEIAGKVGIKSKGRYAVRVR
ncbi:MAG: transcription elongation factor subunit Spt4 [Candidatus Bathyarchaeia archaeon]